MLTTVKHDPFLSNVVFGGVDLGDGYPFSVESEVQKRPEGLFTSLISMLDL